MVLSVRLHCTVCCFWLKTLKLFTCMYKNKKKSLSFLHFFQAILTTHCLISIYSKKKSHIYIHTKRQILTKTISSLWTLCTIFLCLWRKAKCRLLLFISQHTSRNLFVGQSVQLSTCLLMHFKLVNIDFKS